MVVSAERVAAMYVDTVTATIQGFLRNRPSMHMALETVAVDFPKFLARIGAEGDLDAAMAEWRVQHNARPAESDDKSGGARAGSAHTSPHQ